MIFSFLDVGASCPLSELNAKRGSPASQPKSDLRSIFSSPLNIGFQPGSEVAMEFTPTLQSATGGVFDAKVPSHGQTGRAGFAEALYSYRSGPTLHARAQGPILKKSRKEL
jgi:hypothetical protein